MTFPKSIVNSFILEVFDQEQWCPVLQTRFEVFEPEALRVLLGAQADDDPEVRDTYTLDRAELERIVRAFGVRFPCSDLDDLWLVQPEINLYRLRSTRTVPYLVHEAYELPLLLDGRKKLARMGDGYPPMRFEGEDRFDYWVARGKLHREEELEPFDGLIRQYEGHRTVYYTPIGEEWRIPAMRAIWEASTRAGGWNEYFERLEGTLFGYEDWQNDWWINVGLSGGGFGGTRLCCAVTAAGLAWIEAAGYRALPPTSKPTIAIDHYDATAPGKMYDFMTEDPESAALVCFNVFGGVMQRLLGADSPPPWRIQGNCIPELNRHLRRPITVVVRSNNQLPG